MPPALLNIIGCILIAIGSAWLGAIAKDPRGYSAGLVFISMLACIAGIIAALVYTFLSKVEAKDEKDALELFAHHIGPLADVNIPPLSLPEIHGIDWAKPGDDKTVVAEVKTGKAVDLGAGDTDFSLKVDAPVKKDSLFSDGELILASGIEDGSYPLKDSLRQFRIRLVGQVPFPYIRISHIPPEQLKSTDGSDPASLTLRIGESYDYLEEVTAIRWTKDLDIDGSPCVRFHFTKVEKKHGAFEGQIPPVSDYLIKEFSFHGVDPVKEPPIKLGDLLASFPIGPEGTVTEKYLLHGQLNRGPLRLRLIDLAGQPWMEVRRCPSEEFPSIVCDSRRVAMLAGDTVYTRAEATKVVVTSQALFCGEQGAVVEFVDDRPEKAKPMTIVRWLPPNGSTAQWPIETFAGGIIRCGLDDFGHFSLTMIEDPEASPRAARSFSIQEGWDAYCPPGPFRLIAKAMDDYVMVTIEPGAGPEPEDEERPQEPLTNFVRDSLSTFEGIAKSANEQAQDGIAALRNLGHCIDDASDVDWNYAKDGALMYDYRFREAQQKVLPLKADFLAFRGGHARFRQLGQTYIVQVFERHEGTTAPPMQYNTGFILNAGDSIEVPPNTDHIIVIVDKNGRFHGMLAKDEEDDRVAKDWVASPSIQSPADIAPAPARHEETEPFKAYSASGPDTNSAHYLDSCPIGYEAEVAEGQLVDFGRRYQAPDGETMIYDRDGFPSRTFSYVHFEGGTDPEGQTYADEDPLLTMLGTLLQSHAENATKTNLLAKFLAGKRLTKKEWAVLGVKKDDAYTAFEAMENWMIRLGTEVSEASSHTQTIGGSLEELHEKMDVLMSKIGDKPKLYVQVDPEPPTSPTGGSMTSTVKEAPMNEPVNHAAKVEGQHFRLNHDYQFILTDKIAKAGTTVLVIKTNLPDGLWKVRLFGVKPDGGDRECSIPWTYLTPLD